MADERLCRILSLDGGGAKGFYSLGALKDIEALVGKPLCEAFDLIFGTSTGAIIAALLGLGHSVDEIASLYRTHVVEIMRRWMPSSKSAALEHLAVQVFGDLGTDLRQVVLINLAPLRPEAVAVIFHFEEGDSVRLLRQRRVKD